MSELCDQSATRQREMIASGEVSATELLDAHLARIEAVNPAVNAVVAMDADVGRRRAAAVDQAISRGEEVGPLAGLVTAHKDLTDTADFVTAYGSPSLAQNRPAADSLIVSRMKAAGAIAIGKTNTPEFGAGSHTFNPVYGTTSNPWNLERSAGGSSGGAAAALATGMVAIADGSDMGGSLRNPAAWNNVVGFRASPGTVPDVGPGNPWLELGVLGAMGRTVDDLALLLGVISVLEPRDPLSRGLAVDHPIEERRGPVKVAWTDDLGGLPVEAPVRDTLSQSRQRMLDMGWDVVDAEPDFSGADECFLALRAWAFANGPMGALVKADPSSVKETVRLEVEDGNRMSAADVANAYKHLNTLWNRGVDFFQQFDLLAGPVTQISPFPASQEFPSEVDGVPVERYTDWMLSACRITVMGLPALSLPAGFDGDGLPVGIQLIGRPWGDLELLSIAKAFELPSVIARP